MASYCYNSSLNISLCTVCRLIRQLSAVAHLKHNMQVKTEERKKLFFELTINYAYLHKPMQRVLSKVAREKQKSIHTIILFNIIAT